MQWLNEPPQWKTEGEVLSVTCGAKTDFWRKTHADFIKDDGHFYFQVVYGDFTAAVKVMGKYRDQYDHAGLMVRLDPMHWLKCGVEFVDGVQFASTVVTYDFSDWSVVTLDNPAALWLRLKRYGHTIEVSYSVDEQNYNMMRQAYFPPDERVEVGPMICAPTGAGFLAQFERFIVNS